MDCKLTEQPSPESGDQQHEVQLPVTSSAPQGPIWGSILFEIFISYLDYGEDCALSKFAGDTNQEIVADMPEGCAVFQRDVDSLEIWADGSLMKFNKAKCKILPTGKNSLHNYMLEANCLGKSPLQKGLWGVGGPS